MTLVKDTVVVHVELFEIVIFYSLVIVVVLLGSFCGYLSLIGLFEWDSPMLARRIAFDSSLSLLVFTACVFSLLIAIRKARREYWFRCEFMISSEGIAKIFPNGAKQFGSWDKLVSAQFWRRRLLFSDGTVMSIQFVAMIDPLILIRLSGEQGKVAEDWTQFRQRPGHCLIHEYLGNAQSPSRSKHTREI